MRGICHRSDGPAYPNSVGLLAVLPLRPRPSYNQDEPVGNASTGGPAGGVSSCCLRAVGMCRGSVPNARLPFHFLRDASAGLVDGFTRIAPALAEPEVGPCVSGCGMRIIRVGLALQPPSLADSGPRRPHSSSPLSRPAPCAGAACRSARPCARQMSSFEGCGPCLKKATASPRQG